MCNENLRLVEHAPKLLAEGLVAFLVAFIGGIVWEGVGADGFLVSPLDREGKDIPILVGADQVGFVVRPDIAARWRGLYVKQCNFGQLNASNPDVAINKLFLVEKDNAMPGWVGIFV